MKWLLCALSHSIGADETELVFHGNIFVSCILNRFEIKVPHYIFYELN